MKIVLIPRNLLRPFSSKIGWPILTSKNPMNAPQFAVGIFAYKLGV